MRFTICRADCVGNKSNCDYPYPVAVTNACELKDAVAFDHVCGTYKGNRRGNANFEKSDVVVMDLDNDHSDDPGDWITEDRLEGLLPDISYALAPSRHHMQDKDGESARPRLHVYFPITEITDAEEYAGLKRAIHQQYPFFDGNALDAARFLFGANAGEVVWHLGFLNIDDLVSADMADGFDAGLPGTKGPILQGSRNNTLSRFAGRVLKRYGECDKAYKIFLEEADKCEPPMESGELNTIWFSALKFFRTR